MPKNIKQEFGTTDSQLDRAEQYARNKGGGETDGAVYVVEVYTEADLAAERNGTIWVVSSDQYDALVHADNVWKHDELHCFGFDEEPEPEVDTERLEHLVREGQRAQFFGDDGDVLAEERF